MGLASDRFSIIFSCFLKKVGWGCLQSFFMFNLGWSTKIKAPKKWVQKVWTALLLVILTNVANTYVIVKDGPKNLPLEFGQNLVSNSSD